MPQIIVTADGQPDSNGRAVMFTERVTAQDFESRHFQGQLVERLGWAVGDAHALEQQIEREPQRVPAAEREPSPERVPVPSSGEAPARFV